LIQKEVAEKLASDAHKKSFLRWLINNSYNVFYHFTVKPSAFTPPPGVDSALISIKPKGQKIYSDQQDLVKKLSLLSGYKRKTLGKIQKIVKDKINVPDKIKDKRLEEL